MKWHHDSPFRSAFKIRQPRRGEPLNGAVNDVELMKQTLVGRFGFPTVDIVTLLDEHATGAAIREQLTDLTKRVSELPVGALPVQGLIHSSGHGSKVPDQPAGDPNHDEADGLDETLVPYDATRQGGVEDIPDDELYQMVIILGRWACSAVGGTRLLSFEYGNSVRQPPIPQVEIRKTEKSTSTGGDGQGFHWYHLQRYLGP